MPFPVGMRAFLCAPVHVKGTNEMTDALRRTVPLAQGLSYMVTGVWPLLNMRTFVWVTGPKTDLWLVKTVGLLITAIGGVLTMAGVRQRRAPEIMALGVGTAAALSSVDINYAVRGRISRIYLLDAAFEGGLITAWVWARRREGKA
ncbi:MAG: hypothetical protein NVS2B16_04930 [Chloroflexota bacterium]